MMKEYHVVFEHRPGTDTKTPVDVFVELEDETGKGLGVGAWEGFAESDKRADGFVHLVIPAPREWISVDDRLPESPIDNVMVADTRNGGVGVGCYIVLLLDPPSWVFHFVSVSNMVVTHWMPLPDPPEVDDGE